ncbi:MAG: hypothetical protein HOP02_14270 [Methylococcaceae bacterium]|nr:hypothetical protein [Methylococcaceae bacterium]
MKLTNQLRTRFSPPQPFSGEIEQQFLRDYSAKHATRRKLLSVIAPCICLGYFLFDGFYAFYDTAFRPAFFLKIAPLRLTGTSAIGLSTWMVFRPAINHSEHYANLCGICGVVATYFMLLALTYAMPFPDEYFYYYDGMLLVLLYLFGLTKLLTKPVLLLIIILLLFSALTFSAYDITSVKPAYAQEHESPMVFLSIFCGIGYLIALEQEHIARKAFLRET